MSNTMTFGLTLTAKDDTQGALRSALSGMKAFASTVARPLTIPFKLGLNVAAALRDIRFGLAPIVGFLDRTIAQASSLDAVSSSFKALTRTGNEDAQRLAKQLTSAAHGAMRIQEAMQLANRAVAAGLNPARDLPGIFDFASKKAVTTGMDMGGALERIIMGLSRMSAPILDDFGLLNEGIEGVQRRYEALKGTGSWPALSAAAQKTEFIRQAMAEMREQVGRMGVTGNETAFVWMRIKNLVGDSVDKLFAAIGRSRALRDALQGVRDVLSGMTRHFESGGTILQALFGKDKSAGLFGFLKAGLQDVAEIAGRGLLGGMLKGLSRLPELGKALWEGISGAFDMLSEKLRPVFEPIRKALDDMAQWFKEKLGPVADWIYDKFIKVAGAAGQAGNVLAETAKEAYRRGPAETAHAATTGAWYGVRATGRGFHRAYAGLTGSPDPGKLEPPWRESPDAARQSQVPAGLGFGTLPVLSEVSFFDRLGAWGDAVITQHKPWQRWKAASDSFGQDFPPEKEFAPDKPVTSALDAGAYPMNRAAERKRLMELYQINRAMRLVRAQQEHTDKYEVARRVRDAVRRLRAQGADVRGEDREGIKYEIAEQLQGERRTQLRELEDRRSRLYGDLEASRTTRSSVRTPYRQVQESLHGYTTEPRPTDEDARRMIADHPSRASTGKAADMGKTESLLERLLNSMNGLAAAFNGIAGELGTAGRQMAAIGPGRT